MGKHILSNVKGFVNRAGGEIYNVDPRCIKIIDGWNDRIDFSGQEELKAYIKENGLPQPLFVMKNKNNELVLRDGERRTRAVLELIEEGEIIKSVPVEVASKKMNELDIYCRCHALNNGKSYTPIEQANGFKRLIAWGLSRQEIVIKTGASISTVRNRLELSNAVPAVKKAVAKKEISIKAAQVIINKSDGEVAKQTEKLEIAKATPKVRHKTINIEPKDFCKSKSCNGAMGSSECKMSPASCIFSVRDFIKWIKEMDIKMTMTTEV